MINCVVGKIGSGKSYFLVNVMLKELQRGYDVWMNFHVNTEAVYKYLQQQRETKILGIFKRRFKNPIGKVYFWRELPELYKIKRATILVDEMHIWLDSREWFKLDKIFKYKLSQSRHQGLDLWGATQNFKRVDVVFRDLVDVIYKVTKLSKLFIIKNYDPTEFESTKRKAFYANFLWFDKTVAKLYDTHEDIFNELLKNKI